MGNVSTADARKRQPVFPSRLVQVFGKVEGAEKLLTEKPLQIAVREPLLTVLENGEEEQAGVLLDFGRELHGSVRLLTHFVEGESPASVRVTMGESVAEAMSSIGVKNATNDHAARDVTVSVPALSDMTLPESGFRFVCIRLCSAHTRLCIKAAVAVSIFCELPYLGSFSCNDLLLNRIYDTAAYTCHLNLQQYIWDGIKRDRLVWAGDLHPEMLTVRTVFGRLPVLEDTLRFLRLQTPLPQFMNDYPTYSLWWLLTVHDWYLYTGDGVFLDENREYAMALAKMMAELVDEDGTDHLPMYFIDWQSYGKPQEREASRALLAMVLTASEELAKWCGNPQLADLLHRKSDKLRAGSGVTYGSKPAAAMLALAGCIPQKTAADEILHDGAKGFSTFMSYYLLKVAGTENMAATLSALRAYYGGMLEMGATTFWEDFDLSWKKNAAPIDAPVPEGKRDIHGDNGAYCYKGFRCSLCHGWSSAPTAFLAEEVLGIRIAAVGCKEICLRPQLGDLQWAKGTYPLPQGVLEVSCARSPDGSIAVKYTAPKDVTVRVEVCNETREFPK